MKRAPARSIKLNVVFSDLHCGSTVGLMPPGFSTIEGNDIEQNPIQRWLWDSWRRGQDFIASVVGSDPFALTVNGDAVEGVHHGTKQVISPDPQDHLRCAQSVLEPLASRASRVFMVKGTECHVGNQEVSLGEIFGAERDPDSHARKPIRAFDRLTVEMHGTRCAFSHHIGTSIRDYLEATQFSIAINQELTAARTNGEEEPRVICRAHRHRFGYYGNGHALALVTPPWQALTRFGHKVVPGARCHPGVVILDWRGREPGELPNLHYQTYEAPHASIIRV